MNTKNEVFEYLIDQLRQQVNNNQREDLAQEVQSLKNQLRDASAQIRDLHIALVKATGDIEPYKVLRKGTYAYGQSDCRDDASHVEKSWVEHAGAACPVPEDTVVDIKFRNGEVESNTKALWWSWGPNGGPYEIVAYSVVNPGHGPGRSGCRKEDAQECHHNWRFVSSKAPVVCINCGVTKSSECEHEWQFYGVGFPCMCLKCGLKK